MNAEKRENHEGSVSSDADGVGDSGAEETHVAATIPKKRGRPAKANKVKKPPSGRGRGRPPKKSAQNDDDEDHDSAVENGTKRSPAVARGRPSKGSKQKAAPVSPVGRGRGKGAGKRAAAADDDDDEEDDDDTEEVSPKKTKPVAGKRGGRPRKSVHVSDDDGSDEDFVNDERQVRATKKSTVDASVKRTAVSSSDNVATKKRGRPAAKATVAASGANRGRGKKTKRDSSTEEDDSKDEVELDDDSFKAQSAEEEEDDEFIAGDRKHMEIVKENLAAA